MSTKTQLAPTVLDAKQWGYANDIVLGTRYRNKATYARKQLAPVFTANEKLMDTEDGFIVQSASTGKQIRLKNEWSCKVVGYAVNPADTAQE